MNYIPNADDFFKYILYADDTTLFITIHISPGATHEINSHLSEVYDYLTVKIVFEYIENKVYSVPRYQQKHGRDVTWIKYQLDNHWTSAKLQFP